MSWGSLISRARKGIAGYRNNVSAKGESHGLTPVDLILLFIWNVQTSFSLNLNLFGLTKLFSKLLTSTRKPSICNQGISSTPDGNWELNQGLAEFAVPSRTWVMRNSFWRETWPSERWPQFMHIVNVRCLAVAHPQSLFQQRSISCSPSCGSASSTSSIPPNSQFTETQCVLRI